MMHKLRIRKVSNGVCELKSKRLHNRKKGTVALNARSIFFDQKIRIE